MHKAAITALLLSCTVPAFAKTHKFNYAQPCNTLWPAVKDTLRNSGIIGIDNEEKQLPTTSVVFSQENASTRSYSMSFPLVARCKCKAHIVAPSIMT